MTKYIVLRYEDGSISAIRICHTDEQLEHYKRYYAELGEKFTIESVNPILNVDLKIKRKRCPLCGQEIKEYY